MFEYIINSEQLEVVLNYLAKKPYVEVKNHIDLLTKLKMTPESKEKLESMKSKSA